VAHLLREQEDGLAVTAVQSLQEDQGVVVKRKRRNVWCWLGLHKWDMPGGNCVDCGKHDDLFDGPPS
jgi:hypothetical protein